jgi:hypothetical protein
MPNIPACRASVPFAQENETERREGVQRDPEASDQLLLEGYRRRLLHLLVLGQLFWHIIGRGARVDVVDEPFERGAFLFCQRSVECMHRDADSGTHPFVWRAWGWQRATVGAS